ncbi:SDR family NAD(P)-dependent oxidoreductase [Sphingosinicella sp. LY1275]|uniref:SDR family NAD(P)-dependent oxidoreductase n=1 Tax=Sphingosinicella sp. LY1275 TaxID=3095379 RepID=UPI002ADEDEFA|nr:SDR family oxidoreductase [Sphingosinicella sp. LY1275]MEA1015347.1 SDR family oxidoreductase [Sphingosinicella sp. LY1275]
MTGASADPVFRDGMLSGRIAVVTGAGSGVGRAIALRLVGLGAQVTGIGRREAPLAETARQAATLSGAFHPHPCDVRDVDAATRAIDTVGAAAGIDLLVNNAGGQFYAPATNISRRGWDAVIDLNLSAVFSLVMAARPYLAVRRGAVVNISLTGIDRGIMGASHSVAARAGVLGLTRTLALEWGGDGIRLNCIGPGMVFTENLDPAARLRAEERMHAIPLGRPTLPDEVAGMIAFLASDAGRMVTGQLLQIDGGAHIGPGIHGWEPEQAA